MRRLPALKLVINASRTGRHSLLTSGAVNDGIEGQGGTGTPLAVRAQEPASLSLLISLTLDQVDASELRVADPAVRRQSDCHEGGGRRVAWCSFDERGEMIEGTVSADADGLARLVHTLGADAYGCVEMMSGAVWVREQLQACGWQFAIADARKVKAIAPLACKTDKVDARVLAQLAARDLVPELWVPSLSDRELRERARRREHLVHLRTSARNRMFGLLTQWGLRGSLTTLRKPDALQRLSERGVPAVWI
jgi:Transposase